MYVAGHRIAVRLLAVMAIEGLVALASPQAVPGAVIIVVNTTADEDINNATCSLREAIIAANNNPPSYRGRSASGAGIGDAIEFALGPAPPPSISEPHRFPPSPLVGSLGRTRTSP